MGSQSIKFKFLYEAGALLPKGTVPNFVTISSAFLAHHLRAPLIMRSSLAGEAGPTQPGSGKSLSISDIVDQSDLEHAFNRISEQPKIEEIILQEQIQWNEHFTVLLEEDFIFAEFKQKDCDSVGFFYWTPLVKVEGHSKQKDLLTLIQNLRPITKQSNMWLLELGLSRTFYLFQLQPIQPDFVKNLFSTSFIHSLIQSRMRFSASMGFMGLLKTEWKAHVFRRSIKKGKTYSASKVFQNWEFIFHYFRLYCLLHRKSASRDQFVNFLSSLHSNTNKKSGAQEHLKIASWLRENEDMPWLEPDFTSFTDTGLTFIGRGIYRGKIGEKVLILTKLSPDLVYSLHNVDVILTESASLLSHGLLAAVEKKILVVIGFTTTQLAHYEEGTQLILDFDHNKIELP